MSRRGSAVEIIPGGFHILSANEVMETINIIIKFLKSEGKKFGKNTVYSYIEKLEDTQAVFFCISGNVKESWPRKEYICDSGISTIFRFSEDIGRGRLMENAVFLG